MFEKSTVLSFFPTFVWVNDLTADAAARIGAAIEDIVEKSMPAEARQGGGHSLQSDTQLHRHPGFRPLVEHIDFAAKHVLDFLECKPAPIRITGCWANVGGPGAHHKEHSHPNNFLSGVYYVKAPEGANTINFHDPRLQAHVMAPHAEMASSRTASTVFVEVKPGRLVIFPAWLRHSVDSSQSPELRMSISFNLMFDQFADVQSPPRFEGNFGVRNLSGQ